MKIDFIINALSGGGAERVMVTLANGFSTDNEVSLITFNKGSAYPIDHQINRVKLHHGNINNHTLRSWLNLFLYYKHCNEKPDIIVVFMPANALIVIPIAKFFGIKVIVSEHNNHMANPSLKTKWTRKILYPFANVVTILTSYDLDFFKKTNRRVVIMPNPIKIPSRINEFSKRKKNILAAGSLQRFRVKGFDSLLKIAAPLLHMHKDWTLTIAGSGESGMETLKELRKELNLENQVFLPGFCDNIQELMQNSQIFALSSKYEGLPMVLMEALSNGMTCIAYDCISGPRDLIEDNINGLLVRNQDTTDFQEKLDELMTNDKLRYFLASSASNSMLRFDLAEIMKQWNDLFEEIS